MSSVIQDVINRAKSFNPLNANLANDSVEMVTRIQQYQQRVFTAIASLPLAIVGRSKFIASQALTSSNASSNRTVDLTTLTIPLERIVRVTLTASGTEIAPVSEVDPNVELAPRYFTRGSTMTEIGSDWSSVTGTVSVTVLYAYGAAALSVTGGTNQAVSVPDEWIDILVLPLARYFSNKDPGRDPMEYQWLDAQYKDTWSGFLDFATDYAGIEVRRFFVPPPTDVGKA